MTKKTKKILALFFIWTLGALAGAGILALLQNPADSGYWPSVASLGALLLVMMVATWVRNDRPQRRHGLWALAVALSIPALILAVSFGPGPALGALAGSLTVALIIVWPYLTGKEKESRIGSS